MSLENEPCEIKKLPISIGGALVYLGELGQFERLVVGGVTVIIDPSEEDDVARTTVEFSSAYRVIVSLRKNGSVISIASKDPGSKSSYHEIIVFDEFGKPITQTKTNEKGDPIYSDY